MRTHKLALMMAGFFILFGAVGGYALHLAHVRMQKCVDAVMEDRRITSVEDGFETTIALQACLDTRKRVRPAQVQAP